MATALLLGVVLGALTCVHAGPLPASYTFFPRTDAPAVVIRVADVAIWTDLGAMAALCDETPPCIAFTTRGELKAGVADGQVGTLVPLDRASQGVYVQNVPRKWLGGVLPIRFADAAELARLREQSVVHIAAVTALLDITQKVQQQQSAVTAASSSSAASVAAKASSVSKAFSATTATTTAATTVTKTTTTSPIFTNPSVITKINTSVLVKSVLTREQLSSLTTQSIRGLLTKQASLNKLVRNSTFFNQRVADLVVKWIDIFAYSWDSRYSPSVNWVSPVKNQGSCGTCTAFATAAVGETARAVALKRAGVNELSEQFLFFCNHVARHKRICTNGMFAGDAAQEVVTYGFRWQQCYPYNSYSGAATCSAPSPACATLRGASATGAPGKWSMLSFYDPFTIKNHIRTYGAVVTSFYTNGRLNSYTGGIIQNDGAIDKKSGHSVAVVGWNDLGRYWIAKNSWGSWWGESGYFRISYTDPMFCNDGDFGVPVGLTYTPTFLETHPWLNPSVITGPIKQLPVVG